jgi:hypothetical protein
MVGDGRRGLPLDFLIGEILKSSVVRARAILCDSL